jgi:hypothetical protein
MNRTDSSRGKRYFLKTQPILMHMGLCPLDPQQRARPFAIYQLGLISGEGLRGP